MINAVLNQEDWLAARKDLLAKEKAFQKARDELAETRRALPWVRIDKDYRFQGEVGSLAFADLFGPHSQLIVYHFMFHPDWEAGCKSCSFWADNYDNSQAHLAARDVALAAVSTAPLEKLLAYRHRMGWSFPWVSSGGTDFNSDFHVTFTPEEIANKDVIYNYKPNAFAGEEAPGLSVFYKDDDGTIYHTYSTYSRGLDPYNTTYQLLDIVPKGRNEADLPYPMDWLRRHDEY